MISPVTPPGLVTIAAGGFVRGDTDDNGSVSILDALAALQVIVNGATLPCQESADMNDDAAVSIADIVTILQVIVGASNVVVPRPFPERGFDPTPDGLDC